MTYLFYKVLHIVGITMAFMALGGLIHAALDGGRDKARKLLGATHGAALLIVLISGFGLLAKLGLGFPLWVWLKLAIWLLLGAMLAFVRRMPQYAKVFWFALPVLAGIAAYLALYKPF